MEAPETQGKRTVFVILVSSCVFFSAVKVIRLVRFQGRQGGFMSSKAQTREKETSHVSVRYMAVNFPKRTLYICPEVIRNCLPVSCIAGNA